MKKVKAIKSILLLLAVLAMVVLGCAGCGQFPSADQLGNDTVTESDSTIQSELKKDDGQTANAQPHAAGEITLPEMGIEQQ